MFNLGTLLQVCALTMGVASATPICNAKENTAYIEKAETITTDYELTFNIVNTQTQTYNAYDDEFSMNYNDVETKTNYQVQSSYINVLATQYQTRTEYTINNTNCLGYLNYETSRFLSNKDYSIKATRNTYVIQITPYNYNVDTELTLNIQTRIETLTDQYNYQTIVYNKYLNKTIYNTFQNNWATYLNRSIVRNQSNVIINDIEDVNNNYYYTKEQNRNEIADTNLNQYIEDETQINIAPKTTNYIVIDYVISVIAEEYDQFNDTYTSFNTDTIPCKTTMYSFGIPTISGTNIIPDGTYEVIDIPGLMWEILTMPFAFVSQAFNLTLFPGTPYQLNISNLFLSIIAVIVFVWLIGFFLKIKG